MSRGTNQKFKFIYLMKIMLAKEEMGKPRAVPYKDCGSSYDEGWLDEICTENRDDEE